LFIHFQLIEKDVTNYIYNLPDKISLMQVLYIEDSYHDRMAFERAMSKSSLPIHYTCAGSLHEGITCIQSGNFDVILADLKLPDGSALELLEDFGHSDLVIIILTGVSDIRTAVLAMKGGAYDYIVKDVASEYLSTLPDYLKKITKHRYNQIQVDTTHNSSQYVSDEIKLGYLIRDVKTGEILFYNSQFAHQFDLMPFAETIDTNDDHHHLWKKISSSFGISSEMMLNEQIPGKIIRHICNNSDGNKFSLFSACIQDDDSKIRQVLFSMDDAPDPMFNVSLTKTGYSDPLSVLAGGMAHEINNVLTTILGNISIAGQLISPDIAPVHACFDRIELAILQGKDIASRLLTYADGGDPVIKSVDLNDLMRDVLCLYSQGDNQIIINIDYNIPPLSGDPDLLRTAIRAVITNAIEESGPGPVNVQVYGIEKSSDLHGNLDVPNICIEIHDQGSGIRSLDFTDIFNPYFTTKEGHIGLGLTSAKSIIEKHYGIIEVVSSSEKGTSIRIILPRDTSYVPSPRSIGMKIDQKCSAGSRVLILDDEEGIRDFLQICLEKEGFNVDVFSRGEEAIQAAITAYDNLNPYQVAILDLVIPGGIGGKEVVMELKKVSPSTFSIVSSGYSDDNINSLYQEYGFHASLPKPYRAKEMIHLVLSLIEQNYLNRHSG